MKLLNGQWPIVILVIMFMIIPLSTVPLFPSMFEFIFAVLGIITVVMAALLIASVVTSIRRRKGEDSLND